MKRDRPQRDLGGRTMLLVLVLAVVGIVGAGRLYYSSYAGSFRTEVDRQLSAIGELKTSELKQWRAERLGDGRVLAGNTAFSDLVGRYLGPRGDAGAGRQLAEWFARVRDAYGYDRVFLLDPAGVERLAVPGTPEVAAEHLRNDVGEVLRSGEVTILDFHRDTPDGPIHLSVLVPIYDEREGRRPLGAVVLRVDPRTYLYPYMERWPTASRTAETLIVRREGDEVVFLNELRFSKGSALNLKFPLSHGELTSAMAALGRKGIVDGVDYRSEPVVAYVGPVPDSPWFLVARMDKSEVYAPLRARMRQAVAFVGVLLAAAASTAGLLWRQRSARYYRERYEASLALRESQERLWAAVRAGNVGLWDWDLRTDTVYFSPEWKQQIGYADNEIASCYEEWESRLHPDDVAAVLSQLEASRAKPWPPYQVEFRLRHKDGSYRWILAQGGLLFDEQCRPARMFGSHIDVTARREAEEERERLMAQLQQAQKLEAIGLLAGGVAHDFNNMLTVINNRASMGLAGRPEGDPIRAQFDEILKAGERSAALTQQLLAFSRRQVLQPIVLNLNTAMADLEPMLRRLIGEDIELVCVPVGDLGNVKADPTQIQQVIVNLAVNARDAMPQGGKLTIETQNVDLDEEYARSHADVRPGPYVMLAVSDSGAGMDEATKSRIFEPFFTTKGRGKGTGLGLATVYGVVRQSGGNIWVYSEVGKGTTFKVYLPRVGEEVQEAPAPRPQALTPGTETILLVEDEEPVRGVVERILSEAGYTVVASADGDEAVRLLEGHRGPVHMVLTDVVVPGLSGLALAERLGSLRSEIKVLYMSGYAGNAIVHRGILDGDTNFISKPFTAEELLRTVRRVLDA
jgi:PAS domain S-box-containing protein